MAEGGMTVVGVHRSGSLAIEAIPHRSRMEAAAISYRLAVHGHHCLCIIWRWTASLSTSKAYLELEIISGPSLQLFDYGSILAGA